MKKILLGFAIFCIAVSTSFGAVTGGLPKYAQTVIVGNGGSIQGAINAISDASASKVYAVQVQPGIYNETITMKPYVDLVGVDRDSCIITQADANVITITNNCSLANLTVKLTAPSTARRVIASGTGSLTGVNIDNCNLSFVGNYNSMCIGLGIDAGFSDFRVSNSILSGTSASYGYGIQWGAFPTSASNVILEKTRISSVKYGNDINVVFDAGSTIEINSCYINAGTNAVNLAVPNASKYGTCNINNTTITAGTVRLAATNATAATIINATNSSLVSVTKAAGGGTETFNSYGSVVGSQMQNQDGTVSLPAYTYSSDPTSGTYLSTGQLNFVTSASRRAYLSSTVFNVNVPVGLGTNTTPDTILGLPNNNYISAKDQAGTSFINMIKTNASNEVEVGGALNMGNYIKLPADGGAVTAMDMPIISASAGTEESYTFRNGASNGLKMYAESNGSGGVQNQSVQAHVTLLATTGAAATPSIAFIGDPTTGLYSSAGQINFVASGTRKFYVNADALTLQTPISMRVVATTPDAYALTAVNAGSMVYVTSARKMYIRGYSTWESITSVP